MYTEDFCGIQFKAEQGKVLEIRASIQKFELLYWGNGVVTLMSNSGFGKTSIFVDDCSFIKVDDEDIFIQVLPGTASYMKELGAINPLNKYECEIHNIRKIL